MSPWPAGYAGKALRLLVAGGGRVSAHQISGQSCISALSGSWSTEVIQTWTQPSDRFQLIDHVPPRRVRMVRMMLVFLCLFLCVPAW